MVSIVIPCYNQAKYLAEAIESCIHQNCEVIVVDDGSTDNTLEVCSRYPVYTIHQTNRGLASARNTGIMNASFSYIVFLDADDKLFPNAVEKLEEVILKTRADIIAPSFKEFGLSDREVILGNPTLEDFKTANRLGYCAAIKKSVLQAVGGYSSKMVWGAEDYHLWFNLLIKGYKLVIIPDILWMYRVKENSMWAETQKHKDDYMEQIKKDFPQLWIS